jgi:hypothetical protein
MIARFAPMHTSTDGSDMKRIHRTVLAGFLTTTFTFGCAAPPNVQRPSPSDPKTVGQPSGEQPPRPSSRRPDGMDASAGGTVDVLAHKAEAYSREIEPLLTRRGALPQSSQQQQSQPHASPSQVQWMDPNDFRLTDFSAKSAPVEVRPVIQSSPTQANQVSSAGGASSGADFSANAPARAEEPATRPAAAAAAAANPPRMMSAASDQLLEKLSRRVKDYPRDVSAHLEYQLLQFLLDEQVPQLSSLAALPTEDRELITAVLDGLALFRNTLRSDNNMLLSRKIHPLLEMSDRLRSQADLVIPSIALCNSVNGFGKYDPIEPARFAAGAEHRVVIYCEIANFSSNLNKDKMWETRLKQDMTLFTEGGVPVWSDKTEEIADAARVRRQDFFVNKRLVIPGNLSIGRYLLKVTIVDLQANRVAEANVPIVIAAK